MSSVLSTLFGLLAAIALILVFVWQFVGRAQPFGASVLLALVVAGSLFAISVGFDRLDAKRRGRTPARILPTKRGFMDFLFVIYILSCTGIFVAITIYCFSKLPRGDEIDDAVVRLVFVVAAGLLAAFGFLAMVNTAHRLFDGNVNSEWLRSLGAERACGDLVAEAVNGLSVWQTALVVVLCVAVLLDAHHVAEPVLDWDVDARRLKRLQQRVGWILNHPNTVDLFAIVIAFGGVCVIGHRVGRSIIGSGHSEFDTE